MDLLGVGIAVAGVAISTATVMVKWFDSKNGTSKFCSYHSGITTALEFLQDAIEKLEKKLDDGLNIIHKDIIAILKKIGDVND